MNKKLKAMIYEVFGSQADFSLAAMVDETKISKVIRGRKILPQEEQERWAGILGCDPGVLFPNTFREPRE
jgi:hypothetical protein